MYECNSYFALDVCYEEKRNEVSDELAFSFLNKVKRNFFDFFFE